MPAENLKPLHKGKCLEDLQPFFVVNVDVEPKRLCKSAPKLLKAAEEKLLMGDEELSYIYYMKFLSVVHHLKQYKTRKDLYGEITRQSVNEALDYAEKLSTSLKKRYKEQNDLREQVTNKIKSVSVEEKEKYVAVKPPPSVNINGNADVSEEFISCTKLYNLLESKKKLLLMDVRSPSAFSDSHLKADCIMNVPDVAAGTTSSRLEKVLPAASKGLWAQRGAVDLIVLLDWSSSAKTHRHDSDVSVLKDILLKWDSDVQYRNKPLILEGGYEEWLLLYPVCTTNPSPTGIPRVVDPSLSDILDDIEYPSLSESLESLQPTVDRSSKPLVNNNVYPCVSSSHPSQLKKYPPIKAPKPASDIFVAPSQPEVPNKGTSSPSVVSRPSVDRKLKAAALLTYEERSHNVQALLQQEEVVVARTLELEENKQRKEEEREKVRLRREMEAEEEMRVQLQEKEEQLLREIQHLEKLQQEKDTENQALRDELEKYKKKELEENLPQEYAVYKKQEEAIVARIRTSEEKRKKIVHDREKKLQDEIHNQNKRSATGNEANHMPHTLTFEEREKQARAKLHQDRLMREKQKQLNDASRVRGHDAEDPSFSKLSLPNSSTNDSDRDHKRLPQTQHDQDSSSKNKMNGVHSAPLKDTPSGIMKRSRSSPNIAQLNDDDLNGRGMPYKAHFTMDTRSRQRNFSPVYGGLGRGLTGLKNLGNTCYMNSIIQCLSNTTPLAKYFVSGEYINHINRGNETRGEIAEEVAAVVRALWSSNYKCIATRDLRSAVGKHRDQFQSNQQQDSNEFLTILMDWLHEDLKKPMVKAMREVGGAEQSDCEKQWEAFYKENMSLIVLLFYGQQKSTVQCLTCCKASVRYETFSNLTLPLPSNANSCTLEECVQLYVRGERITGWKCPDCKEQRAALKKFDIIKLPPILVIHFKRFYIDGWCRKRQTFVQFPLVDWDMKKHTLVPGQKYTKYHLYGVSNHYGTMEGGHYTAYCKSVEHKKWYKFDDNEVSEISSGEVQSAAAYILFYASINLNVPEVS